MAFAVALQPYLKQLGSLLMMSQIFLILLSKFFSQSSALPPCSSFSILQKEVSSLRCCMPAVISIIEVDSLECLRFTRQYSLLTLAKSCQIWSSLLRYGRSLSLTNRTSSNLLRSSYLLCLSSQILREQLVCSSSRELVVSPWVLNFWMISLASMTPVTSFSFLKAYSQSLSSWRWQFSSCLQLLPKTVLGLGLQVLRSPLGKDSPPAGMSLLISSFFSLTYLVLISWTVILRCQKCFNSAKAVSLAWVASWANSKSSQKSCYFPLRQVSILANWLSQPTRSSLSLLTISSQVCWMDCASLNLIITLSSLFSRSRMVRLMGFSQRNPNLFSSTSFNLSCSVNSMLFLTRVSCFSLSRVILRQFQSLVERPILVELSAVLESTHLLFLLVMKSSLNPFSFLFSFFNFSISSLYFSLISSACLRKARLSSSSILFFWFWWSISESMVTAFRSMAERARIIVMLLNRNCNIIRRRATINIQKSRDLRWLPQAVGLRLFFLDFRAYPTQLLVDQLRCRVQLRGNGGQFSYGHELGVFRLGDMGLQDKGVFFLDLIDLMDGLFGGDAGYGRIYHYFLEFGLDINCGRGSVALLYQK